MGVFTAAGTRVFLGTTAIPDNMVDMNDAQALAVFEADSYVEIGEVENLGEFGDESQAVTFASLKDGRSRKFKGTRDAGTIPLVVGHDATDEGQLALVAAEASPLDYNVKVVSNDALTLGGQGSVDYFYGKVMSKRKTHGDVNNIVRGNYAIGINSRIVTQEPS
jgi:hypothetical protein